MDGTALAAIASVVVILLAIIGIAYAFKSVSKVRCKALEKHVVRKEWRARRFMVHAISPILDDVPSRVITVRKVQPTRMDDTQMQRQHLQSSLQFHPSPVVFHQEAEKENANGKASKVRPKTQNLTVSCNPLTGPRSHRGARELYGNDVASSSGGDRASRGGAARMRAGANRRRKAAAAQVYSQPAISGGSPVSLDGNTYCNPHGSHQPNAQTVPLSRCTLAFWLFGNTPQRLHAQIAAVLDDARTKTSVHPVTD
eukprot:5350652-Pyramimonas_sp.AAC.3